MNNTMKKIGGFCKYWYSIYQCVGFTGIIFMKMAQGKDTGCKTDYVKVWDLKD